MLRICFLHCPQKVRNYLGVFLWKEKLDKYFRKNKSKLDYSSVDFNGSHTSNKSWVKKQNIKAERNAKQLMRCISATGEDCH